jgi:hypothetical protein
MATLALLYVHVHGHGSIFSLKDYFYAAHGQKLQLSNHSFMQQTVQIPEKLVMKREREREVRRKKRKEREIERVRERK